MREERGTERNREEQTKGQTQIEPERQIEEIKRKRGKG